LAGSREFYTEGTAVEKVHDATYQAWLVLGRTSCVTL